MNAPLGPKWRNWQTRMIQGHVPARVWGFESPLRHQLLTSRCRTQAIAPVFIRSRNVGTCPNAPNSLTIGRTIRDREGAAWIRGARYAAHVVSLTRGAMVGRAYRQRSLVAVLLADGERLGDAPLRRVA